MGTCNRRFFCNWCTYGAVDLASVSRMGYPPNVRVIRVCCSGRVSLKFILAAFCEGIDGVWISGCHPGGCHAAGMAMVFGGGPFLASSATLLVEALDEFGKDFKK